MLAPSTKVLFIFLSISRITCAFEFPFKLPWPATQLTTPEAPLSVNSSPPLRIAIVGSGAGGSSAAFWLAKAKERHRYEYEVDVFEKSDYIGGRSTVVYPYENKSLTPFELGASIFVRANKNLIRAAKVFEFELLNIDSTEGSDFGIYDGQQFVAIGINDGGYWKYWDNLKLWWRYGYPSPATTNTFVSKAVQSIDKLYQPGKPYKSIEDISDALNFTHLTAVTAAELLDLQGVSKTFSRELVEAATRVNYAQNIDQIHGLAGLVSMADSGALGVKGGNYQIFEQFIKRSGATIHLGTEVTKLSRDLESSIPKWILEVRSSSDEIDYLTYDHVIHAAPLPSDPPVSYVRLHVTLLTTTSPSVHPSFLNQAKGSAIPHFILTTWEGARNGGTPPDFNSISYHEGEYWNEDGEREWYVKVFSMEEKSDEWLESVFGKERMGWVLRKQWNAYPVLPPTTKFPSLKLEEGFWYPNAMELWISTMETTTISSRNVVDLLLTEQFGSGICGEKVELDQYEEWGEEKVWGWDCWGDRRDSYGAA